MTDDTPTPERVGEKPHRNGIAAFYAAGLFPSLIPVARSLGYALAVHGSLSRDLDVVAVPWTEDAASSDALANALARESGWTQVGKPELKPHGRVAYTIALYGTAFLDLSVMPIETQRQSANETEIEKAVSKAREAVECMIEEFGADRFDGEPSDGVECAVQLMREIGFMRLADTETHHA